MHYAANLMAACPKNAWTWVADAALGLRASPTPPRCTPSSTTSWPPWADQLPKVAAHLEQARTDVLAVTAVPKEVWR
ncbi:Transposase, Mutator family [Geodermatophilus amargosae]|uniref:Transposase, Mutator family n=1 Tax=Geodermatophilus amargosae TaxID=1296565 RepID=A0A1I7D6F5_9ACTN|nr:Transposase, Mutator family [Geodermatophilus amargosae]